MTNEELIQEKLKEIENLKREIKSLREPVGVAGRVNCGIWRAWMRNGVLRTEFCENVGGSGDPWLAILRVCLYLHSYRHKLTPARMKVGTLNEQEVKIAAAMAEEIVTVWNKYFEEAYAEEINAPTPPFRSGEELEKALAKARNK